MWSTLVYQTFLKEIPEIGVRPESSFPLKPRGAAPEGCGISGGLFGNHIKPTFGKAWNLERVLNPFVSPGLGHLHSQLSSYNHAKPPGKSGEYI